LSSSSVAVICFRRASALCAAESMVSVKYCGISDSG